MIRIHKILLILAGACFLFLGGACSSDRYEDIPVEEEPQEKWITLQFTIAGESRITRGYPMGGEDGNGREDEISREARIHDINVFLFADDNALLNAAPNTRLHHMYFNLDNPNDVGNTVSFETEQEANGTKTTYTVRFRDGDAMFIADLRARGKVRFITVANLHRSIYGEVETLQQLWDYGTSTGTLVRTWEPTESTDISGYDYFVMTTAYDGNSESSIDFTQGDGKGSKGNPFSGVTTLQRMCARIDIMYDSSNLKEAGEDMELFYEVDMTGAEKAKVYIQNMLPVNVMNQPSYVFKKVTNGIPSQWTVEAGTSAYTWGGKETTDAVGIPNKYVLEPTTLIKENIQDSRKTEILTDWYGDTRSIAVRYSVKQSGKGKVGSYHHYAFNTVYDENKTYSHISVIGYANENIQSPNQFNSNFMTGLIFRATYVPADIEGEVTDRIYRYSPSAGQIEETKAKYFSSREAAEEYGKENPADMAVISEFNAVRHDGKWGFVCYYNLWLRHYNDESADPQLNYPMEYAIVRNNIYRVAISFTGPGDPEPTMREPDTMQARIFVRKWNRRMENQPLEF